MGESMLSAKRIQEIVDPKVVPTAEQEAIIEAPPGPLLVVAGAGSGKTETMAMRVLWALANHEELTPGQVLGLTFTKKAAGELAERLSERVCLLAKAVPRIDAAEAPVSLTYNAFAQRIVGEHALRIGVDPDFRMLGEAGCVQLMTDILMAWPKAIDTEMSIATAVNQALSLSGQLAEHEYDLETARARLEEYSAELEEIPASNDAIRNVIRANRRRIALLDPIGEFQRRKRQMGVLDFSDQLVLATRIVHSSPEAVASIRGEHRFVLLDEFQDTSVIQMSLLSALFHDHPVTAVGDPNQAIYGWRGASASSLDSFLDRFSAKGAGGRMLALSTAWRNDRRILTAANRVAEPLRRSARTAPSPVLVESPFVGEGDVRVSYSATVETAAAEVAEYVEGLRRAHRGEDYSIAVLARKRKHFLPIDHALRDRGIPTQIIGLGGLLDQPAVSDLRSALEITEDVQNSPALLRLLVRLDLGAADLAILGKWAGELAVRQGRDRHSAFLLEAVDNPPEPGWRRSKESPAFTGTAWRRVSLLGSRLRALRSLRGRGLVDLAERAMNLLSISDDAIADPLGVGAREALDAFIDVIADFEESVESPTLSGLLSWLEAAEENERGLAGPAVEADPLAVQILTVHQSKGLEWDGVIVFGLTDGSFPSHDSSKSITWCDEPPATSGWVNNPGELPHHLRGDAIDLPDSSIDLTAGRTPAAAFKNWLQDSYKPALGRHAEREERRLAYVALTRAKHDELLIGSWFDTATKPHPPSRYLEEARFALVDDARTVLQTRQIAFANGRREDLDDEMAETLDRRLKELESAVPSCPQDEELESLRAKDEGALFPVAPGPSRELVAESAERVRRARTQLHSDADVFAVLLDMGATERVRDITALLKERRLRAEEAEQVIWRDRIPATAVSSLVEDPRSFALKARRPMPNPPAANSSLGTLFHLWAERQLHQASGELWEEPITGLESLDEAGRARFQKMTEHFSRLEIVRTGSPIAIEEPFSLELAGMSIAGRIDAVFSDAQGRTVIVDWKSGMTPNPGTDPAKLRYFATQLRLYRAAWARVRSLPETEVDALLAFVATGEVIDLPTIERLAGVDPAVPIEELVRHALESQGRSSDEE
ncbi:ATP-dependent DNA helicase [Schaalia hyovaginalis]|uniref:ATP-dependent helicase n=1 Tax=Schaalia hyovaginalis TaxID=29316 RepID=UPI002A8117DB|nr:ATP-dependent DNA helicase [Schaalia hyovaginalis]MDY3665955.1 ATP-dependent DNA helicase [Schaalia hyovaginalis]